MSLREETKQITQGKPLWVRAEGVLVRLNSWWIDEIFYDEYGKVRLLEIVSNDDCEEEDDVRKGFEFVPDIIRKNFKILTEVFRRTGIRDIHYRDTKWWKSARYLYYYDRKKKETMTEVETRFPEIKTDLVEDIDIKIRDAKEDYSIELTDSDEGEEYAGSSRDYSSEQEGERILWENMSDRGDEEEDDDDDEEDDDDDGDQPDTIAGRVARRKQPKMKPKVWGRRKISVKPARPKSKRRIVVKKEDLEKKLPGKRKK
jgi:hypothetical protein